jgi:hypothetical protein
LPKYKYGVPYLLPDGKTNPEWNHASYLAHKEHKLEVGRKYYLANSQKMIALKRRWRESHKDWIRKWQREHSLKIKSQAVMKTNGRISCAIKDCRCDDLSILQANYIAGGHTTLGNSGKLSTGGLSLYRDIAWGRVDPGKFNFLCPPHNSIDHLKNIRKKFRIQWTG